MAIASKTIIFVLILVVALGIGGIVLQIFLSRRESKWPGLILPLLTFLYAFLAVCQKCVFWIAKDGEPLNLVAILTAWLIANLPTLILLGIYWAVREKRRVKTQIDKMKIDDL